MEWGWSWEGRSCEKLLGILDVFGIRRLILWMSIRRFGDPGFYEYLLLGNSVLKMPRIFGGCLR